jgi:hypothetical protein
MLAVVGEVEVFSGAEDGYGAGLGRVVVAGVEEEDGGATSR